MKNKLVSFGFLLISIALMSSACNESAKDAPSTSDCTKKDSSHQVPKAGIYQTKSAHQITFEEAYRLIACFLGKENLRGLANQYALGGTIPLTGLSKIKEKFNEALDKKGIANFGMQDLDVLNFYPCYDKKPLAKNKVFICYTPFSVKDVNSCGCGFRDDYPIFSFDNSFIMGSQNVGEDDIKSFLENQSEKISDNFISVNSVAVDEWTTDFMNTFKINSGDGPLNSNKCGYFEKTDWDLLINQYKGTPFEPKAIRYFFGYDGNKTRNKIRLIMIAAYTDPQDQTKAKNLVHMPPGATIEPVMIEKAWPPDNCL